jgi:LacI family transcriptional regulator
MAVTGSDIARELGVSQSTVSRALRGDPRIALGTRERVAETARRLGYTPNLAARALITSRTRTVGVVVPDIVSPVSAELLDILHGLLSSLGYRTLLLSESADALGVEAVASALDGRGVDGVLWASATLDARSAEIFSRRGVPIVLIGRSVDRVQVDSVIADDFVAGRLLGRALVLLGHHRIGHIAGPRNTSTSRDREAGLRAALEELGCPLDEDLRRTGEYSLQAGYQWCMELMTSERPPTAIVCGDDSIAFGALDGARRLGIKVPQELSITGVGDVEMASWELISLTTVREPLAQMAKTAVRMLTERMESDRERDTRDVVFPVQLVQRDTSGPAPPRPATVRRTLSARQP